MSALFQSNVPRIVASFSGSATAAQIARLQRSACDMVELRVDLYPSWGVDRVLKEIQRFSPTPTLATIRSNAEGGEWHGTEAARLSMLQEIIPHVSAVDVELSSETILSEVIKTARNAGTAVLLSYHAFGPMPSVDVLSDILKRAEAAGADLTKIAVMVQGRDDLMRLARFTIDHADRPIAVLGMGDGGVPSRLLFPALGSRLTYAYIGRPTAPGQWAYDEITRLFARLYPDRPQDPPSTRRRTEP